MFLILILLNIGSLERRINAADKKHSQNELRANRKYGLDFFV